MFHTVLLFCPHIMVSVPQYRDPKRLNLALNADKHVEINHCIGTAILHQIIINFSSKELHLLIESVKYDFFNILCQVKITYTILQ